MFLYESMLNFEIYQILWCQNVLQPLEKLLTFFSVFTKMATVYAYVIPLLYLYNPEFYIRTLLTSIGSNILMNLLKWIISEGRPYWYVFSMPNRPILRQTEITCETSAGNPSGHVTFQAAFLHIILTEWWIIYLSLINLVALSRMYFACHFFHQCLLGAVLGHFIARYTIRNTVHMDKLYNFNKLQMLAIGLGITVLSATVFLGQKLFNIDPLWSIKIAFNRCENPLYLKPESTPVFAIIRDLGLFSGFILSAPVKSKFVNSMHWLVNCFITVIIMLGYHAAIHVIPHSKGVLTYYSYTFLVHLGSVFILLNFESIWKGIRRVVLSKYEIKSKTTYD